MSGDNERESEMDQQSKVIQLNSNDIHRIFQEISAIKDQFTSINEKLTGVVRIEEKVSNLSELHTNLRDRLENMEERERISERELAYALQQAREFDKIKDSITVNKTNNANVKNALSNIIHWVGAIASAIVIAAILNNNEPKTPVTRDDHKTEAKVRHG